MQIKINLPQYVEYVMNKLQQNGYEAYFVGGSVRDILMNIKPHDYDICTNAVPQQVKNIFDKTYDTGIKHGTVTVVIDNKHVEVTTYRIDGIYKDCRHPETVEYTNDLYEDLSRRDFTVNSLVRDIEGNVYDYFNGIDDLNKGIIRCVGNADARFRDDSLRILRCVRFACVYGFSIEDKTMQAIINNKELLNKISKERIRDEFCKIINSNECIYGLNLLKSCGLIKYISKDLDKCIGFEQNCKYHNKDVFDHSVDVMGKCNGLKNRLAGLLHDVGKIICANGKGNFYGHEKLGSYIVENILRDLRFDNKMIEDICLLIKYHMVRYNGMKRKGIKKLINKIGRKNIYDLLELQRADINSLCDNELVKSELRNIDKVEDIIDEIFSNNEALTVNDLDINGYDVMEMGYVGREVGIVLNKCLEYVLNNGENSRDVLIKYVRSEY